MLDLATLKASLQPIRQIGEVEERFNIQGTQVCMRVLNPKEELEIQRWAQKGVLAASPEDQENDNSLAVEYLNKFKLGCLSYSIVEVDGLDLRDQEFVATGEVLQNGQPVKIKRTEAVRQMLEEWPRPLLTAVFRKFNEIMERCEINSDKSIEFNPPDIDSEIQRVMQRLQTLEEMRQSKQTARDNAGDYPQRPAEEQTATPTQAVPTQAAPTPAAPTPDQPVAPTERVSAIPSSAAAVEPQAPPAPVAEPVKTQVTETSVGAVTNASGAVGTSAPSDGWVDKGDADSLESAVAAENARLMQMRAKRLANQNPASTNKPFSGVSPVNVSPVEPEAAEITGRHPEPTQEPAPTSTNPRFTPPNKR